MNCIRPATGSSEALPLADDSSRAVLQCVQRLLAETPPASFSPECWLGKLAQAFGADCARFVGVYGSTPAVQSGMSPSGMSIADYHWTSEKWSGLISQALSETPAKAIEFESGRHGLITVEVPIEGSTWLLWVERPAAKSWTPGEKSALKLAQFSLIHGLTQYAGEARWSNWLDRARRQAKLESAATIVSRLAHDFNNVLTGVLGFTELGLGQLTPGTVPHQFINEVYQAAQQGTKQVAQLSLFSKRGAPRSQPSSLAAILGEERSRLQLAWGQSVTLEIDLPRELPQVAVDGESLVLVLGHILQNAREATAPAGIVRVSARQLELTSIDCVSILGGTTPGQYVELTVGDTGPGFSPEARQRALAEPFFSTKPRHRGLGLSSVYGLLQVHRGGLRIEHRGDCGAIVRLYMPFSKSDSSTLTIRRNTLPLAKGERVLIVDDDPLTLQLMCTTLERAGYRIQSATDGVHALETYAATAEPFQLVLSDVVMPRMTGFELAQQLLDRNPNVNVLFTSGHIPPGLIPENFSGRHFDLLPKPFRPEGLLKAVRGALDRDPEKTVPALAEAVAVNKN